MRGLDSPWGLRVAGLVGVAVVAAGAYGAGALPGRDPGAGLRGPGTPGLGFWLGLTGWVVGLAILSTAWWRIGRRLDGVSGRWLLVTGVLWALPLLLAPPLASRDIYSYACQGEIWHSGLDPYAVGAVGGGCPWSDAVPELWQHTPAPYGPVGVALSGIAASIARAVGGPANHQLIVAVTLLRIVALVGGALIAGYAGRLATSAGIAPAAARWLGLLSPLVAVQLVSAAHNDALTAGLTVAALAVAVPTARSRISSARLLNPADPSRNASAPTVQRLPETAATSRDMANGEQSPDAGRLPAWWSAVAAGGFLGLAIAIKVTAVIALPFVILLAAGLSGWAVRRRGVTWGGIALAAGAVTVTAAAVFALASLATGLDLGWVGALSDTGSLVQWTSLPTGIGMAVGYVLRGAGWPGASDTAVDIARAVGIATLAAIGLVLCWRALQATLGGARGRKNAGTVTEVPTPKARAGHATTSPTVTSTLATTRGTATTSSANTRRTDPDRPLARADTGSEAPTNTATMRQDGRPSTGVDRRRQVIAACGWTLAAATVLLPVFYPWYALAPLAVLACATPPGRTRTGLAIAAIALTALVLPNGLGLPVLTKLPGAILDVAIVALLVHGLLGRRRRAAPRGAR